MLRVHILRSNCRERDDIITVRRNLSGDFIVHYTDKETSVRYSFTASRDNLVQYFWSVFDFLRIDEEPFERVQILSPVHPSAMFFVKELNTAKVATIMRALKQLFHNWPRSLSPLSDVYEGI
jgi:hypothetical protein